MEKLVNCLTKCCKRERTMRIDSQVLVSRIVAPETTTEPRIGSSRIETSHEMWRQWNGKERSNRATLSPTKVGAGHPNDVHPPNDVFFPLCIQPPPTSTTQPHHVWILYQFGVSYRRGYRCISWRRIQVCKHCSSGIWSSCSNASKTTSRNSHLIIWTEITWICSEYWAKGGYMYIFDTSGQAVDFCSAETSSGSSKFPTAAGKSREFSSSWTALVSTISTAKFSVFQEKTNFSCRW